MKWFVAVTLLGATLCAQEGGGYDADKALARKHLEAGKPLEALKLAGAISKRAPDDYELQYTIAKAYRLSGQLEAAEKTTQWLLDLRPENLGGLHEAGLLREQFGDLVGAVDLLNTVFRATPVSKHKERAELLRDIARIFEKQKMPKEAAELRQEAERLKGLEIANEKATTTAAHR
jgi:tetratricopeptide (TPR) repeat protein